MAKTGEKTALAAVAPAPAATMERTGPRQALLCAMEAITLLVAVALPMTLSPFTDSYFEVQKAFFIRVAAMAQALLLVAWGGLTLWARGRRGSSGGAAADSDGKSRGLLVCAALALAAVTLLTAMTAINRGYALAGCPQRGGGVFSVLAGVVLFIAATVSLRQRAQGERLVLAVSLGCLPCVVFMACEAFGAHPMGFDTSAAGWRLAGPFGNANFLASFCAVSTPLVLGCAWRQWRQERVVSALVYAVTGLLLATGIAVSRSRGPLLALLAGGGVALLLLLATAGRGVWARRLARAAIAGCVIALVLFYHAFVAPMQAGWDGAERQSGVVRTGSVAVRLHIYKTIAERMLSNEPLRSTFGASDPWHAWRFWIGYGPQNLMVASERFLPAAMERLETPDKGVDTAHCLLLELWLESGLIGVLAWGALFAFAVITVARAMRLASDSQTLWQVCGMIIGGAALFALLLALFWGGWAWGFGFAVGTVAGVLYAVYRLSARGIMPARVSAAALAPATALLVFLFDAQMGVLTVSAVTMAWLMLGILQARDGDAVETADAAPAPWLVAALAMAAAVLANAGLAFNHNLSDSPLAVWRAVLLTARGLPGLMTVLVGVLLTGDAARWRRAALWPAALLVAGWLADMLLRAAALARAFGSLPATAEAALALAQAMAAFEWWRYALVALAAAALALAGASGGRVARRSGAVAAFAAAACAAVLLFRAPAFGMAAQSALATAKFFEAAERPDIAAAHVWRAVGRSMWDDACFARLHRLYGNTAYKNFAADRPAAERLFAMAEQMLARERLAAPYDPHSLIGYGRLYQLMAKSYQPGSPLRRRYAQQAVDMLQAASGLAPGRGSIKLAEAAVFLDLLGDDAAAAQVLDTLLAADAQNARAAEMAAFIAMQRGSREPDKKGREAWLHKAGNFARQALASPWRARQGVDAGRLQAIVREADEKE